jgi:hypothetical protein
MRDGSVCDLTRVDVHSVTFEGVKISDEEAAQEES